MSAVNKRFIRRASEPDVILGFDQLELFGQTQGILWRIAEG
jgi:hypothetical protein